VVTFFEVHTTFAAFEDVKEVVAFDADGEHHVVVARSVTRAEGGDGPFPVFGR
jgi:predicted transcriptional regulator